MHLSKPADPSVTIDLSSTPSSAQEARFAISHLLTTRDVPVLKNALVMTSELVSNAALEGIRTRSDTIGLTTHLANDDLLSFTVEITNPDSEHGRDLVIVNAFSHAWGARLDGKGVSSCGRCGLGSLPSCWRRTGARDGTWVGGQRGAVTAHHHGEALTLLSRATLGALREPMAVVSQVLALRVQHPQWEFAYDRSESGPFWVVDRHRADDGDLTFTARTCAELRLMLLVQGAIPNTTLTSRSGSDQAPVDVFPERLAG